MTPAPDHDPRVEAAHPLWCCHVRAPDDVHPAPDYATALPWADYINLAFPPQSEDDPIMGAVPAPWPWSAEQHAKALPDAIASFATDSGVDLRKRVEELRETFIARSLGSTALRAADAASPVVAVREERTAIDEIVAERRRQIEVEGWSTEHDDRQTEGGLACAAGCYAIASVYEMPRFPSLCGEGDVPLFWPWRAEWWKPKDPRRDLIRGGALIVAEIQRLERAAAPSPPRQDGEQTYALKRPKVDADHGAWRTPAPWNRRR